MFTGDPARSSLSSQAEITMRTTQASLRIRLGLATPQDHADATISRRLSGEGVYAADGDIYTKKRHTFSKAAAVAK